MADSNLLAGVDDVGVDVLAKVEEIVDKLKSKNFSLHRELVAERAAHARVLMDNIRIQRDKKRVVVGKEEAVVLLVERSPSGKIAR